MTNVDSAVCLVRPRFTDAKIKSFMVVRAGNSARFNINFEVITWKSYICGNRCIGILLYLPAN